MRLLNAALINDFTMLTFQRPLRATDSNDLPVRTNATQAVIWAVGPVNSQGHTSYHTLRSRGSVINFILIIVERLALYCKIKMYYLISDLIEVGFSIVC